MTLHKLKIFIIYMNSKNYQYFNLIIIFFLAPKMVFLINQPIYL